MSILFVKIGQDDVGFLVGFFYNSMTNEPVILQNILIRKAKETDLDKNGYKIVKGKNKDDIIKNLPDEMQKKLYKKISELEVKESSPSKATVKEILNVDDIIKKDISANIIVPDFVPVVFDPTRRGNRKPFFHYK